MMSDNNEVLIFSKGTEVDLVVKNLVECLNDKEDDVREALLNSLVSIGKNEPKLVLSSCLAFLKKNSKSKKVTIAHRISILKCMEQVIKATDESLTSARPFICEIVKQVVEEMTISKELVPEWQEVASNVLVALSSRFCNDVMEELTLKLQPSVLPHFFVLQTMSNMAVNNAYDMVPFLNGIITQTLTFLGMAKLDNMRWVIAYSMAKFCEAIQEYLANPERASDPSVTTQAFSSYVFSAYEVFFNVWLQTRENKLRVAVIDALSQMVHIIDQSSFESNLSKLISGIINQYKRCPEPYYVSRALAHILEVACRYQQSPSSATSNDAESGAQQPAALQGEFDSVINCLFTQLTHTGSEVDHNTLKNQNELRRCFATLCNSYPDKVVTFLLGKFDGPDRVRCAALIMLRHLVSSCEEGLRERKSVIVSGMRNLLPEVMSNRTRLNFAHAVIAMGGQGYLDLEGGNHLVEYIIKQCALSTDADKNRRSADPEHVTNAQLRHMCENILYLSSSTVAGMRKVLWPYLLEFLVPAEFTEAVGAICRSLGQILEGRASDDVNAEIRESGEHSDIDFIIDYDEQVNIPRPQYLVARLFVLVGLPLHGNKRGIHVLKAMQALSLNFHENLRDIWNIVIPKLVKYYNSTQEINLDSSDDVEFDQTQWEDLVLKMVAKSIEQVCDEEWTIQLGEALGHQISLYDAYPEERSFLFKCLGTVMANSSKKSFYESHLELVFNSVRHQNVVEREGMAVCFGLCAASHLDAVLACLELRQRNESRRTSGIFGFIKERASSDPRSNVDKDLLKSTMLLAYGYVIYYAPPDLVTSRLEANVMKAILPAIKNVKDPVVKSCVIRCVDLIGQALEPERLGQLYRFEGKTELLSHLMHYVKAEPMTEVHSEVRSLAFKAAANLVVLDPVFTDGEMRELLTTCTDAVYPLPPDGANPKKVKEMLVKDQDNLIQMLHTVQENMNNLFVQILLKSFSESTLTHMFTVTQKRLDSLAECERQRALLTLQSVFGAYLTEISKHSFHGKSLCCLGEILGHLVPRVADPHIEIRQLAIDCVYLILQIQSKLEGSVDESGDKMVAALPTLKERLRKVDSNIMFSAINDLSKVFAKKIPSHSLSSFLSTLYVCLLDSHNYGSAAVCVVINTIFKIRAGELSEEVPSIVAKLHDQIEKMDRESTSRTGTVRAVKTLAAQHLIPILNTIMAQHLPLDDVWCEILTLIGSDSGMLGQAVCHLIELQLRSMPYEERDDPKDKKKKLKIATHAWLSALNCLQVFCRPEVQGTQVLNDEYSKMLACWIMAISTSIDCYTPQGKSFEKKTGAEASLTVGTKPISILIDGLKNFLLVTQSHDVSEELTVQKCWEDLENQRELFHFLDVLVRALCETQSDHMNALVNHLAPSLNAVYEPQRLAVCATFGSIVKVNSPLLTSLLDPLMTFLLGKLGDSSGGVRRLALIGLGNSGECDASFVQKHSTTLLSSLTTGMDDRNDPDDEITHAAMDGLTRIMHKLQECHVRDVLMSICLKMLPCYEKQRSSVRAAAFRLFGTLSKFATGPSYECYLTQLGSIMVSMLLHLNDVDQEVVSACKLALKQCIVLLPENHDLENPTAAADQSKVCSHVVKSLREDARFHYGEFINELSKLLIVEFPDHVSDYVMKCVTFFKSEWPEIQCNAVMMTGFLLGNFPESLRSKVQKEHIFMELINLLKSPHANVRGKAAEAISLLYMY